MQQPNNRASTLQLSLQTFYKAETTYSTLMQADGDTPLELRSSIMQYALQPIDDNLYQLPIDIQLYVQKLVESSYKIVDSDLEALQTAGLSSDFIFEITIIASMGAGLRRFDVAISTMNE